MFRTYIVVACVLLAAGVAHADPADQVRRERRHDYSRFSDGPRAVPTPRGASQIRARALGLGTREVASRLMHQRVPERWLRVASWRGRNVERLLWPVDEGRYVRGFGYIRTTRPDLRHDGVDISAPVGAIVRAAADGIVAYSDNGIRGFGNCVIIVHPNGWVSLYAHNSRTTVQPGWRVRRGERIALVGSTGISRGPHVHFELFENGANVDPLAHFDGGPAFVRRVARRAFEAGRVAEPQAPSPDDRASEEPLADTSPRPLADEAPIEGIGTRRLVRRLHRFTPSEGMRANAGGRTFRNALWPVRGGSVRSTSRRGLRIDVDDAPLRATNDALVVYATRGVIVLLHPMGWVTTYRRVARIDAALGSRVERGAWIGRARGRVHVELRIDGERVDPLELMVRVPSP